jgi:hypothetical protein
MRRHQAYQIRWQTMLDNRKSKKVFFKKGGDL